MNFYHAIRPLLFSGPADPEWLHQQSLSLLTWLDRHTHHPPVGWLCKQLQQAYCADYPALHQTLWGLSFQNPVGLAAGFDKDGVATRMWPTLGFGFAEVGTVTWHAQSGNPPPRLFRLPIDQAALNRMGFNNAGAAALAARLQAQQSLAGIPFPNNPIGINLGKSKVTPLEAAVEDYCNSFRVLQPYGDYFVVNVSSPNTPGLRSLQAVEQLRPILTALQAENPHKPLLVKIAPDLSWEDTAAIVDLALATGLAGIIATNTTISREGLKTQTLKETGNAVTQEAGGISGTPLRQRSTEMIRAIYRYTEGKLPIVGVGGIFTAEDAWEKITAGASLIQVYTGWIYQGPGLVRQIAQGLVQQLEQHGLNTISQAVGLAAEEAIDAG